MRPEVSATAQKHRRWQRRGERTTILLTANWLFIYHETILLAVKYMSHPWNFFYALIHAMIKCLQLRSERVRAASFSDECETNTKS